MTTSNTTHSNSASAITSIDIDSSCRFPVGVLISKAIGWLFLAVLFEVVVAAKLVFPEFLDQFSWLSFGRLDAAANSIFWYGFMIQAGVGLSLWILCRLGRNRLEATGLIFIGFALWNLALCIGVLGILAGDSTGIAGLEIPVYGSMPMLVAYLLLAGCVIVNFHARNKSELYASQWFILAAALWFPWVYSIAQYLLFLSPNPVGGGLQSVVSYWYNQNLEVVVGGSIAFAVLYYLVPKLTGKSSVSSSLAKFSFWGLVVVGSWGGIPMGAPYPAWYTSIGVVGSLLIVVPIAAAIANLLETTDCKLDAFKSNLSLNWVTIGLTSLVVTVVLGVFMTLVRVNRISSMTFVEVGIDELYKFGFIAGVVFAGVGYVLSALYGTNCKGKMSRMTLPLSVIGLGISFIGLVIGGILQGLVLNIPEAPFVKAVAYSSPFLYLHLFGMLIFALGQFGNLVNVSVIVVTKCFGCCGGRSVESNVDAEAIGAEA